MSAVASAVPSAVALGKRRLEDAPVEPSSKKARPPQAAPVQAVKQQERRVTRSSLGGQQQASREASVAESEGLGPVLYLPLNTHILLTTRQVTGLTHHPPLSAAAPLEPDPPSTSAAGSANAQPPGLEAVSADAPQQAIRTQAPAKPLFRQLDDSDILPPRGARHAGVAEADTSDAFYLRLHRYPEVLEKRASRLERERLIHERSKLINEIEELRGRTWVYAGTSAGGRAEEERQRRIREMEERLARYDALLPNQPRKSNFLNLASSTSGAPLSASTSGGALLSRRDSRGTDSPAPPHQSSSHGRSRRGHAPPERPLTPVSAAASANGAGTRIRITFGGTSTGSDNPTKRRRSRAEPDEEDDEDDELDGGEAGELDLELYTLSGERRKGPKRDRKAERARAEERKKLGLPPRASLEKALTGSSARVLKVGKRRSARQSYAAEDDEEDDEEDDDVDEWDDVDSETGRPTRASAAPLARKRLIDSFFHSASLRDSVMAAHQKQGGRRSSSRVAYAFGQRLPDAALLHYSEFAPHGGVTGDSDDDDEGYSRVALEEMVQQRSLERHGEKLVLLDGRVLPQSALDVWRDGPLSISPVKQTQHAMTALAGVVPDSASETGSVVTTASFAPAAAPLRRNGSLWARDDPSPSVSRASTPLAAPPTLPSPSRPTGMAVPPMSLSMS